MARQKTFQTEGEALEHLRQQCGAFRQTFQCPVGREVYEWLSDFCRMNETCFHENPYTMAALEGRRDVILAINKRLNMTPDELFRASGGIVVPPGPFEEDE